MFDRDNWVSMLIDIGVVAGTFYAGRKSGHNQAINQMTEMSQQEEIEALKKQVNELKMFSLELLRRKST